MNKATVIGNLTKDPESRQTASGKTVCNFTVAANRKQKDETGRNIADFFRITAWDKLAESCQKYLSKGKKVCAIGPVSVNMYTGNDGETRASLELNAIEVEFLSPAEHSAQDAGQAGQIPAGATPVNDEELPF